MLERLGFEKCRRVGAGGHQYKYKHPLNRNSCPDRPPFIIVPTKFYKPYQTDILEALICFGFSRDEIKDACRKI
ncbi:MAG: hypothetical protein WCY37_03910 [Candidatus Dojkabacteria bacterium]